MSANVRYTVLLEPDDGSVRVIVPAFPEIHTFGKDESSALERALGFPQGVEVTLALKRLLGYAPGPQGNRLCLWRQPPFRERA